MQDLPFTLAALRAAYAEGLSPEAVVDEVYRRIAKTDDPGIYIHLRAADAVRAEAARLGPDDGSRPLWGVPFAIKDNIDAEGLPTTAACPAYAYEAAEDAACVALLRAAGALLIGKTNLDQFATGLVGVRSPFQPPRNALDPALVPGGSSSGSAVAVARGQVAFALGTDTAGSGRVPAALNGIVGLKPSLGAVSARGVVPACRSLDTVSVFTHTVEDAHAVFRAIARFDPADSWSRDLPAPPAGAAPPAFRVGVPDAASLDFDGDAQEAAAFAANLGILEAAGAEILPLDFTPFYDVARMLYEGAWVAERYTVIEDLLRENPAAVHPVTAQIVGAARDLSAADAFRGLYRLQDLKRRVAPLIAGVDLLATPTIPRPYSFAEVDRDPIGPNARLGTYTNFVNLLDLCALACPMPAREDGRPGSLTLLAPAGRDHALAALGEKIAVRRDTGATGWRHAPAGAPDALAAALADPAETVLAVCGAHMSGLPLNGELVSRGGRFLATAETAPDYRLFALAGGPPARPGLVRIAGDGAAIALELWALPAGRLGDFVRGIPAPLGIGTLALADGTPVKGFLCESEGTAGGRDITAFGGWRAFIAAETAPAARQAETG